MPEIPKTYEPAAIEAKWYAFWEHTGCFTADPASPKPAYSIVIPPPNVTGVLTLGHVLNNTIQDILARRARMTGREVLWLPGTDHAGIATQNAVEKALKKAGEIKHRDDLGREAMVAKIWEWKDKYGGIILKQLRALGASCDWSRTRFTMDEHYSQCVSRVFVDLYKKGLIYRGKRMVNWCPASLTALSDEEVIPKEQNGFMYHFRVEVVEEPGRHHPGEDSRGEGAPAPRFLTIATTRPETIPADTAVAVNPNDPRYKHLIGGHVYRALPLDQPKEQRRIPIIADEQVAFDFGTGVLKVTPAHDKTDYEIGQRHNLPIIDVLTPDAKMTAEAGADLAGLDRFAARKKAAEILEGAGALEKAEPYKNNVGFSERADVPIEPRLSEQWFLKYPSVEQAKACVVGSTADPAVVSDGSPETSNNGGRNISKDDSSTLGVSGSPATTGQSRPAGMLPARMRFYPNRWAKVYDHWMTGIQDWCISRQLWWGHRVPVWRRTFKRSELADYKPAATHAFSFEALIGRDKALEQYWQNAMHWNGVREIATPRASGVDIGFARATAIDDDTVTHEVATICVEYVRELEGLGFTQDSDVLDTWFSSWLWPFATMGWPEKTDTLARFYPTTDLVTGPDIIFFWVARMIMAGYEYMGELPFRNVYFTGIIRDKNGVKMQKSLGNSPDPLVLMETYSADALRFGIIRSAPLGTDVIFEDREFDRYKKDERYDFTKSPPTPGRFPQVELGRNFCTKLWNAARFRQMQGGETEAEINPELLTSDDKWVLARLDDAVREVSTALDDYCFSDATAALYRFFWSEYCDWYVEASKASLTSLQSSPSLDANDENGAKDPSNQGDARSKNTLAVMDFVFSHTLRLFHPFIPFITEELWNGMGFANDMPSKQGGETIMFAPWPKPFTDEERAYFGIDETSEALAKAKYATVEQGRGLRRDFNLASGKKLRFVLKPSGILEPTEANVLRLLLNAEPLDVLADYAAPKGTPVALTPLGELFLPLEGVIDVAAERERIGKELAKVEVELGKVRAKLADQNFAAKVPAKVLEEHQQRERDWADKHAQLAKMREALGA